jgi:long-chain acyl-CoA synthetase
MTDCKLAQISLLPQDKRRVAILDGSQYPPRATTYEELNYLVERATAFFASNDLPAGSRIGLFLENSAEFASLFFALFRSRYVAVPISLKLTKNNLELVARDCAYIICDERTCVLLPSDTRTERTGTIFSEALAYFDSTLSKPLDNDEALILFTSGSTGRPKGVIHTQAGLGWKIQAAAKEIIEMNHDPQHIHFLASPLYHMNGLSSLLVMLTSQLTILINRTFNPETAVRNMLENKPASFTGVPAIISQMIAWAPTEKYPTVRWVNLGSAPMNEALLTRLQTAFPRANIRNNYGSTEVGPNLFGDHPFLPRPNLSVGYPRAGIEYRITEGFLQVKSPSQFKNYTSGLTDSKRLTADGFYITNDVFRKDDEGFYFYVGRADDMIVCGGENIYLHNIDQLLEAHPKVVSAVTIALPDEIKGHKPYSFIVVNEAADEKTFHEYLQLHLTANSIPRKIWSIQKIPLTDLGKVARKSLEDLAQEKLKGSSPF